MIQDQDAMQDTEALLDSIIEPEVVEPEMLDTVAQVVADTVTQMAEVMVEGVGGSPIVGMAVLLAMAAAIFFGIRYYESRKET